MSKTRNHALVTYLGQPAAVACDRRCDKAWGVAARPRVQLSDDPDDWAYLADAELGQAPDYPLPLVGSLKPASPDDFPTRWCCRACERCAMSAPGEPNAPLALPDWTRRRHRLEVLGGNSSP